APIDFDLSAVRDKNRVKTLTAAVESQIHTFGELFLHPNPPVAILKLAKTFFKSRAGAGGERHPEQQIAYIFYLIAILTALVRARTAVSSLTATDLQRGVAWSLRQSWLQGDPRNVLESLARECG